MRRAIAASMLVLTAFTFAAGEAEPAWKNETWPAARQG